MAFDNGAYDKIKIKAAALPETSRSIFPPRTALTCVAFCNWV